MAKSKTSLLVALPPLAGGAAAVGATLLVRQLIDPLKPGNADIFQYASLIGAAAGAAIGGAAMYALGGTGGAVRAAASALVTGVGLFAVERATFTGAKATANIAAMLPEEARAVVAATLPQAAAVAGMGVIIPESLSGYQGYGHPGLGAVLMEQESQGVAGLGGMGAMGDSVQLQGSVNANVYGRSYGN